MNKHTLLEHGADAPETANRSTERTNRPMLQLELKAIKRQWVEESMCFLQLVMSDMGQFTSDDLHVILHPPQHPNWFGILLAAMKNKGLIRRVNAIASKRPEANGRLVSVWEANV